MPGSRNEVWAFPGYSGGQPVKLFVKLGLSTRAMMVEVLCAQIADCLRIGASHPYLVTVRPKHAGRSGTTSVLAFGVEDISDRTLAKPIQSLDILFNLLRRLKVEDLACAFDEFVGNDVRSPSDILVGTDAHVYFIDHEAAMAEMLKPTDAATNWLADRLLSGMTAAERGPFLRRLRARSAALQRLKLDIVPSEVQFSQDGVTIYGNLLAFLRERLNHLDQIMSQRVHPEQLYLAPAAPSPTSTAAGDAPR